MTFTQPFTLGDNDEVHPAGDYIVETDEELLEGISFPVYRRVSTVIYLRRRNPGRVQARLTSPDELQAALKRDRAPEVSAAHIDGKRT